MQDSNSENPFVSPVESHASSERYPETGLPEIAGSVVVAMVVSVGALIVHPVFGILVVIVSVATIARTWIVVNRRDGDRRRGRNSVLTIFVGSGLLMSVLFVSSLLAVAFFGAVIMYLCAPLLPHDVAVLTGFLGGSLAGLMLFGFGFWALLPERSVVEKNHDATSLDDLE